MAYGHALLLSQDNGSSVEVLVACNADAQTWTGLAGQQARRYRADLRVGLDGIVRLWLDDEPSRNDPRRSNG